MSNMILIKHNLKHLLFLMCESHYPTLGSLFFEYFYFRRRTILLGNPTANHILNQDVEVLSLFSSHRILFQNP